MNTEITQLYQRLRTQLYQAEMTQDERVYWFNQLSALKSEIVGFEHPVLNVQLLESCHIKNNDYNPNKVAPPEYRLLRHSILQDGVTMPVVVGHISDTNDHVIIDGYHRTQLMKTDPDIIQSLGGYAPVVILNKNLDARISSSVRHNMARGSHQVELTAELVIKLRNMNWTNEEIGKELGMTPDEILRMQQITGLAFAFKDNSFSQSWE